MRIGLDYDGTFTLDVNKWMDIIHNLVDKQNCNLYLVTSRNMEDPVEYDFYFKEMSIPIIYCNYEAKKDVCERLGVKIDIWVDNDPYYIVHDFKEEVAERWRATREM